MGTVSNLHLRLPSDTFTMLKIRCYLYNATIENVPVDSALLIYLSVSHWEMLQ